MTMLLAEELLLLALDPVRGVPVNSSRSPLCVALSGALVAELGLAGLVTVDGRRFVPVGPRPAQPLLADVHRLLGTIRGHRSVDQIRRMDRALSGVWSRVVDPLAGAGVIGRRVDRVLLFVPVTHHPVLRADVRDAVVARMREAAAGERPLDARTATVLALAGPARLLEVVAPDRAARRHARHRIATATDQTPVAPIVKKVIQEAQQAVGAAAASTAAMGAVASG